MPSFPIQRSVIGAQRGVASVLLSTTDPAAQAIINRIIAVGGTIPTGGSTAVNDFVTGCKTDSIWPFVHLYGFIGGTNPSHAIDWANPSGTAITWNGSVTSDVNGSHGDGSSYGDLGFNLTTLLPSNNIHGSVYSRTSGSGSGINLGTDDGSVFYWLAVNHNGQTDVINGIFATRKTAANTSGGLLALDVNSNARNIVLNGVVTTSDTTGVPGVFTPNNVWCFGRNDGGALSDGSSNNICFMSFGSALGAAGQAKLYTRVQALQTALGRNV